MVVCILGSAFMGNHDSYSDSGRAPIAAWRISIARVRDSSPQLNLPGYSLEGDSLSDVSLSYPSRSVNFAQSHLRRIRPFSSADQ